MNIQQIRAQFPQYSDLSDKQLADALHAKFYSDIPIGDYYKRVGFAGDTSRTFGEATTDVGAALLRGTGQALQFPGQLVGLVPGMQGLGEALATPGGALAEYGQGLKSAGLRAREALRNQALSDAEKEGFLAEFATAIGQTIKDPALLSTFLLEQVPQLIGPAAAAKVTTMLGREGLQAVAEGGAREAAEKTLRERAAAAAVGTGAAAQGASVGDETYKAVYELALQQGMSEEDARALALEKARVAAFEAGAISVATSRLPGGAAIERRLAGLPGVPGAGRIGVGAREALTEGVEEAGGAFAKGVGVAEVDPSISPLTGVGTAAGFGVLGGAGMGALIGGSPTAEQRAASEAEAPIDRLKREAAEKAQAEERARAEPVNRAQTVINETEGLPIGEAFPRLTQEIETLRQQPKSPERDKAIKALTEERRRRQTEDAEQLIEGKRAAQGFMTAEEAGAVGVVPRGEFDAVQAEIEDLTRRRDALLVKGKPPAPKSPARRQFDELDARIRELSGTLPTAPTAPTGVEAPPEPTVRVAQGPKPLPEVLDSETIKAIGFVRGRIHDALVGKSITDPEIRAILEEYKQGKPSPKTVAKIDAFLGRLPEPVAPHPGA
jgi:nitroreductase